MRKTSNNDNIILAHDYNILPSFREVFLHASTYDSVEEEGVDFKSAVKFQKNIRLLTSISDDPILVHMNIPGGHWEDGLSIYDTIKECPAYICILAYGKVQSASSVILQAADRRILMPNTTVLIHYGSISLDSEHTAVASNTIKWNERETKKMVDIFVDRCKNSPIANEKNWKTNSVIKKHIESQIKNQGDWIMNATDAVYYGFADGIFGSDAFPNTKSLLQ